MASSYKFCVELPRSLLLRSVAERAGGFSVDLKAAAHPPVWDRDRLFAWAWETFTSRGLQGVHEGTMLSEEASEQGLETESWTVDAAEAPRDRDWIAGQGAIQAEFYFASEADAQAAQAEFVGQFGNLGPMRIEEQVEQDWNAEWKASFKGIDVPPFWRIVPPWDETRGPGILKINPGAGFGTGTHETTQLCLKFLGETAATRALDGRRVLDFGSGSGILAIGAALLGAQVDAVEIDPLAVENSEENARLNGVETRIRYSNQLESEAVAPLAEMAGGTSGGPYDWVIANILRPVLLEYSEKLVRRLKPGGTLILSGLIATDVPEIDQRFSALLGGTRPVHHSLNEWQGLKWVKLAS